MQTLAILAIWAVALPALAVLLDAATGGKVYARWLGSGRAAVVRWLRKTKSGLTTLAAFAIVAAVSAVPFFIALAVFAAFVAVGALVLRVMGVIA